MAGEQTLGDGRLREQCAGTLSCGRQLSSEGTAATAGDEDRSLGSSHGVNQPVEVFGRWVDGLRLVDGRGWDRVLRRLGLQVQGQVEKDGPPLRTRDVDRVRGDLDRASGVVDPDRDGADGVSKRLLVDVEV